MITANLATYPPRRGAVPAVAAVISPQVDFLNVVLNEFEKPLPELDGFNNVRQIIPDMDTKDVGKFYPDTKGADFVLTIDDDLIYPPDYVAKSVENLQQLGPSGFMGGYHGSLYTLPKFGFSKRKIKKFLMLRKNIADNRKVYLFQRKLEHSIIVDQIASGTAIMRGVDFPDYEYMANSQKFVDVRLARWCFEKNIKPVCFAREAGWLDAVRFEESIYQGFTKKNPTNVAKEIWKYAYKTPGRGDNV